MLIKLAFFTKCADVGQPRSGAAAAAMGIYLIHLAGRRVDASIDGSHCRVFVRNKLQLLLRKVNRRVQSQ